MTLIFVVGLVMAAGAAVRGNWSPCGESLQAQIHPLGEGSRGNQWGVTILFFTIGSVTAGMTLGAIFGLAGSAVGADWTDGARLGLAAIVAVVAGALDLAMVRPWTPRRQVNENWIGRYRGWVYGAAFGIQLGLGFAVFVMSWGYYAMLLASFLTHSPLEGAFIGAVFGLGRGMLLYLSRRITTPEALRSFHRVMAAWRPAVFRATGTAMLVTGVLAVAVWL